MELVSTLVWAVVWLCAIGAGVHLVRYVVGAGFEAAIEVAQLDARAARAKVALLELDVSKLAGEVQHIREGLEKLKAIPPKQARL